MSHIDVEGYFRTASGRNAEGRDKTTVFDTIGMRLGCKCLAAESVSNYPHINMVMCTHNSKMSLLQL